MALCRLQIISFPEQCCSHPDHCRSFQDRLDEVVAHTHGQLGEAGQGESLGTVIAQFTQRSEAGTPLEFGCRVRSDGHEATQRDAGKIRFQQLIQSWHNVFRRKPMLRRVAGNVHFDEGIDRRVLFLRLAREPLGDFQAGE
jgi:hypothetical protein